MTTLLLALVFPIVTNTATVARISSEGLLVSVNYVVENSSRRYAGRARIELQGWYNFESNEPVSQIVQRVVGMNFGTESSYLEFQSPRWFRPLLHVCAAPDSAFVRRFPSFVITSQLNGHDSEIILDSVNPEEYAYEGVYFYSPLLPFSQTDIPSWIVNTAIYFEEDEGLNNPMFMPCKVDIQAPRGATFVPEHVVTQLLVMADDLGIDAQRAPTISNMIQLSNIDDETLASLPTLKYIVQGDNGEPIHIASLSPHEYTERDRRDPTRVSVLLRGTSNYCLFDSRIVKGLAIHFDSANNRLGFGDAL